MSVKAFLKLSLPYLLALGLMLLTSTPSQAQVGNFVEDRRRTSEISRTTLQACLNQSSDFLVCKSIRDSLERTETKANQIISEIESVLGTPGILIGSATKAIVDQQIRLSNTIPLGHSNEFLVRPNEVRFQINWDF